MPGTSPGMTNFAIEAYFIDFFFSQTLRMTSRMAARDNAAISVPFI
jgi:hypothetical protein